MFRRTTHRLHGRPWFSFGLAALIALVDLALTLSTGHAQESSLHLPVLNISSSSGVPEQALEDAPDDVPDEVTTPDDVIESELLAEAIQLLPEPLSLSRPTDAPIVLRDSDADGVPDAEDNCPFFPNPPVQGKRPELCGPALRAVIDDLVFLSSRIFPPHMGWTPIWRAHSNLLASMCCFMSHRATMAWC